MADFDNVADLHHGRSLYRPSAISVQGFILLIVQCLVLAEALDIIDSLLHQSNHQHEGQRRNVGKEVANFESWHELGQCDEQEEQVVEELELVEEHDRHECQHVVLVVVQLVGHEPAGRRLPVQRDAAALARDDPPAPAPHPVTERLFGRLSLLKRSQFIRLGQNY